MSVSLPVRCDRSWWIMLAAAALKSTTRGCRWIFDRSGWIGAGKMEEYLTIDASLQKLAAVDPRQAEIVEETAQALAISEKTVKRDWSMARAWLRGELEQAAHR